MQELSDDEVFEPDSNCQALASLTASSPYDRRTRFVFPHFSNNDSGYDTRASHSFSDLETSSLVSPDLGQTPIGRPIMNNNRRRRISETMTSATTTATMRAAAAAAADVVASANYALPSSCRFSSSSSNCPPSPGDDEVGTISTSTNTAIHATCSSISSTAPVAIICSNNQKGSGLVRRASWPGPLGPTGPGSSNDVRVSESAGSSLGRSPQTSASPRHHLCSVGTQTSGSFESLLDGLSLDDCASDNEPFDDDNVFSPSPASTSTGGPVLASSVPDVILPAPSHCRWSAPGLGRQRLASLPLLPPFPRADEPLDRFYGRELRRFADHFSAGRTVANQRRRRTWSVQVRVNLLTRSNLYPGGVYVFCFVVARWLWNTFWRSRHIR